jgi:hypothetical protein
MHIFAERSTGRLGVPVFEVLTAFFMNNQVLFIEGTVAGVWEELAAFMLYIVAFPGLFREYFHRPSDERWQLKTTR